MRIELRIPSGENWASDRIIKLLTELQKSDFLYLLKIDCTVEIP